jgi:hypothetical protein
VKKIDAANSVRQLLFINYERLCNFRNFQVRLDIFSQEGKGSNERRERGEGIRCKYENIETRKASFQISNGRITKNLVEQEWRKK